MERLLVHDGVFFPVTGRWEIGKKRKCKTSNSVKLEGKLKYIGGKIWSRVCLNDSVEAGRYRRKKSNLTTKGD